MNIIAEENSFEEVGLHLNFGRLNIPEIVGYLAFFYRKEVTKTCRRNNKHAKASLMELR
jgi:hypothetical protein